MHSCGLPGHCNEGIPVPRILWQSLTQMKEVPRRGMVILNILHKFPVLFGSVTEFAVALGFVARALITHT